ncbi:CHAP domain-containing protein [Sphaerisporangium fuscum]|uniref:CHAP domain-containing protein n=1 Tax=Sphaerisporangium fuscum TaxID=2835868 RepID=UPI001BDD04D7|nr:CHAP domain-containing protein [Sphaerisporangium fuscum]
MSPELQKLIHLLRTQLGYSEQAGGYTKFGSWYGKTVEFDSDYSAQPWCDMFLSWGAHSLGYDKWFGQFAYTVDHAKWFIEKGAWGHAPKPGAVVFFDWGGSEVVDNIDHVGLVTSVDGDTIHTIEGNVDGQYVREKVRDQSYVVGYGYPDKIRQSTDALILAKKAAAESALPVGAATMGVPVGAGGLAGQQDLGALVIPVLIAALVVLAYLKVQHAGVRLAAATRRHPGRHGTAE